MPMERDGSTDGKYVSKSVTDTVDKVKDDLKHDNAAQAFADVDKFWHEHRNDPQWATFLQAMRDADKCEKDPQLKAMLDNFEISYTGTEKGTTGSLDIKYRENGEKSSYHDAISSAKFDPIEIVQGLLNPSMPPSDQPVQPGPLPGTPQDGNPNSSQPDGSRNGGFPGDGLHGPKSKHHGRHIHPAAGPGTESGDDPADPDPAGTPFFNPPDRRDLSIEPN